MKRPTLGIVADAQEAGARFAGSGSIQEWVDTHIVAACTGLPVPTIREMPARTRSIIEDRLYQEDPASTVLRVSGTEPPWTLVRCTCTCGCVLVCVDHVDDPHSETCPQEPIIGMRRIITDDVIFGSNETGVDLIKLLPRISGKSVEEIRNMPHYLYWPLRSAVSRSMNDPLWPGEPLDPLEALVALNLSLDLE